MAILPQAMRFLLLLRTRAKRIAPLRSWHGCVTNSDTDVTMLKALLAISNIHACGRAVRPGSCARLGDAWLGPVVQHDTLGDTQDRWQTGFYTINRLRGMS